MQQPLIHDTNNNLKYNRRYKDSHKDESVKSTLMKGFREKMSTV